MKALQIVSPGEFTLLDLPDPKPAQGEVVLKVLAVTTCPHWDMHIFRGNPMFPGMTIPYPYTVGQPGHEACGEIVAVGPGVEGIEAGQRVSVWRDPGHDRPGCYAQYVAVDAVNVIPVPPDLPPEHCAPVELAMCVSAHLLYADKVEGIRGKTVGVFGLGPAGLLFVQLAKAAGAARVMGFDPIPERRELAERMGAEIGGGAETRVVIAFDCAGVASGVHQAMEMTNRLVVLFAVQREPYVFAPKYWPGLTLAGTQPHTRVAAEYAVARLIRGQLDLSPLVTHKMPLEDYERAVGLLETKEAIKVAFLPWGS